MTIERTIIIPDNDNDGRDLSIERSQFEGRLLEIAGGYTADDVRGAWRGDDGTVYHDTSTRYTVALTPEQDAAVLALLPQTCAACRQECLYTAARETTVSFVAAR